MTLFNINNHFQAFREIIDLLSKHRQLTVEMTKRELSDRYAGQVFGLIWAFLHPLAIMTIYVFVFGFVFKMKIGGTTELPLDYTTYLLAGLIPWLAFQEALNKSTVAIVANASLVKQVVFPIEVLPVKAVLASLVTMFISLLLLITYVLLTHGSLHWTYILLVPLIFMQTLAMIGVAFILSAVGAYFRDMKDIVQVLSVMCMYLMPIFYLPAMVPGVFRPVLYANPFSYLIWCYQDALYFGRIEHPWAWVVLTILSLSTFYVGYRIFRKLKSMFGNIL